MSEMLNDRPLQQASNVLSPLTYCANQIMANLR